MPTPEDTLLLRACLNSGKPGKQACEAWLKQHAELQNGLRSDAAKAFLPLFLLAVQNHGIETDTAVLTVLRTAALREELRTNTYNGICRDVFSTLLDNGIPTIVLAGAALADTVYSDPALRHSHDIDILIPDEEIGRAGSLLPSLGFEAVEPSQSGLRHWKFRHACGLPLELHSRLFQIPCYSPPLAAVWSRSQSLFIAGVSTRTLAPADNLLYLCGHASYSSSRHSLRWVSDAWFILDRHRELDWDLLLDCASRSHLALPLSVMLGYLAEHLDAPIPATFLKRLDAVASQTDAAGWEAALWGTLPSTRGDLKRLIWATPNWRARVHVIKWLLIPSPHYLRWAEQMRHAWLLPLYYLYRPLRYIGRRAWFHCKNFIQRKALQGDPVTP
ncbi:MAG: nucleotidyltransferase domain-containing protein [Gammaproteobacteria bacterium]